jgi:hypothetical protein
MVVAEVGMVAEIVSDGTAMVAGTVVKEFMFTEVAEVILDGAASIVIIAEVAVVSEVTKVSPDGKSMVISVAASLVALAPVSGPVTVEVVM